jgi:hypothetical protein
MALRVHVEVSFAMEVPSLRARVTSTSRGAHPSAARRRSSSINAGPMMRDPVAVVDRNVWVVANEARYGASPSDSIVVVMSHRKCVKI